MGAAKFSFWGAGAYGVISESTHCCVRIDETVAGGVIPRRFLPVFGKYRERVLGMLCASILFHRNALARGAMKEEFQFDFKVRTCLIAFS